MTGDAAITGFRARFRQEGLTPDVIRAFRDIMYDYYETEGREFPWRETDDPYRILVSEVMLQQTQTSRVVTKYLEFIAAFPDFRTLSEAPLRDILAVWQGLGYNRRAIALQKSASIVMTEHGGSLPDSPDELRKLPGIGPNTAGAIMALAFHRPETYIETNIRAVFHYFFFPEEPSVPDVQVKDLVTATMDTNQPRQWYFALYDYGAMLKRQGKATDKPRNSQSRFAGSDRQVRGNILKLLVSHHELSPRILADYLREPDERLQHLLSQLEKEGFITISGDAIRLRS